MEGDSFKKHNFDERQDFITSFVNSVSLTTLQDWFDQLPNYQFVERDFDPMFGLDTTMQEEFAKICPLSLTGKACAPTAASTCAMGLAKGFPAFKYKSKSDMIHRLSSREHPWITQVCLKWLKDSSSCDSADEEHMKTLNHHEALCPFYEPFSNFSNPAMASHRSVAKDRHSPEWDPESSVGTESAFD
jgi:hypothetical protein